MGVVPSIKIDAREIDLVTEARFWANVSINWNPGACWHWKGKDLTIGGYGRFKLSGRRVAASRVCFALFNGLTPKGLFVCHSCDNPVCVRPDHLFLATATENMLDKVAKNRHAKGSRTGTAILTEAAVLEIRQRKEPNAVIGKEFGVAKSTIQRIKRRSNWAHVA